MNDKKEFDFRTSSSDFATYLMLQGYDLQYIEVIADKRHYNRLKAFIHFKGIKEILIELQRKYDSGNVLVEPIAFSITRKKLNKEIKDNLDKYRLTHNTRR